MREVHDTFKSNSEKLADVWRGIMSRRPGTASRQTNWLLDLLLELLHETGLGIAVIWMSRVCP